MSDSKAQNRILLVILTAAFALSFLDRQILNITLNDIGREFQLTDLQLGTLSGLSFAVVYVVFGFPIAKLCKPGRQKKILTLALATWSILTALTGFAGNYVQLILLRIGVGIGEAGGVPPSHAMIGRAYLPEKRGGAIAFFSSGANVGIFLSFLVGGIIASIYGWRVAFYVASAPGIILAIMMILFLKEPPDNEGLTAEKISMPTYRFVLHQLLTDKSSKHVLIGAVVTSIVGYGTLTWLAAFLTRSHGLDTAQAGIFLGIVVGIGGAFGSYFGGAISDRLGLKRADWRLKSVCAIILISKPFAFGFYLIDNTSVALICFVLPAIISGAYMGPSFAHLFSKVDTVAQPMVTAIMMLMFNLIGLGLGPVFVGLLSDGLVNNFDQHSLRYALVVLQLIGLWGAAHFWMAGKCISAKALTDEPLA